MGTFLCRSAAALALTAVVACGGGDDSSDVGSAGEIHVVTVTELQRVLDALAADYEASHDGVDVVVEAVSRDEAAALVADGEVDLYVDERTTVDRVVEGGEALGREAFGRDILEVITAEGNPKGITGIGDFDTPDVVTAVCGGRSRCAGPSRQVLAAAGVTTEPDVVLRGAAELLAAVGGGQVDVGLLWRQLARAAADEVDTVAIPEEVNAARDYEMVRVRERAPADELVDFILSEDGRTIRTDLGVLP
jgi:molybdate transport system substrate-binding protein